MRKQELENRAAAIIEGLQKACYTDWVEVSTLKVWRGDYPLTEQMAEPEEQTEFAWDESWGGKDGHTWFSCVPVFPETFAGKHVMGIVRTGASDIWNTDNPQILVYRDGVLEATLDMNHQEFLVSKQMEAGAEICYSFYAYSNTDTKTNFFQVQFAVVHPEVFCLYYDLKTLYEAVLLADEDSAACYDGMKVLQEAMNRLDLRKVSSDVFYASVEEARRYLDRFYQELPEEPVTVYGIGHTHIDIAWKWTVKQTRQKAVRSFLTVLRLMEEYPEYIFLSSQPQLYEFVKEDAPELYERIKERVKEGRWETEGAMWLEADCNLASGESLVRQILYGNCFMKEEFGVEKQEILWLPDVFGYSGALPQIMKQAGIRYFMTTKIAWNDTNKMPDDIMYWEGIDGSRILTYFITTSDYHKQPRIKETERFETTYNGRMNPSQTKGTWQRFSNKELSKDVLTCYGYGDGGGGTTREMLEYARRMKKGIYGVPKVKLAKAGEFFHKLEKNLENKETPSWCGELYLEYHRGTYTSMASAKRKNRRAEWRNQSLEALSVLAERQGGCRYDKGTLERMWKITLLNQFHDIIPGSSIREVYEASDLQYEEHEKLGAELQERCIRALTGSSETGGTGAYVVFNGMGRARGGMIDLEDGTPALVTEAIPGMGMKGIAKENLDLGQGNRVLEGIQESEGIMTFETPYYRVEISGQGEISMLYDKRTNRQTLREGHSGNRLIVFEDRPKEYDAWNIDSFYESHSWRIEETIECRIVENTGIRGRIFVRKRFLDSEIRQNICFYRHSPRIDFKTEVDWREHQLLCKVEFPVEILAAKAVYDIQFGNTERPTHENTSWDKAKFEVCAHKWADLSECGYGVALLNDCKYGYDIHHANMRLTLIKSGIFPNPDADQGRHEFIYSLLPHLGDFREGNVVWEAYDLNCPLQAVPASRDVAEKEWHGVEVLENHVALETYKALEHGDGYLIRLHEFYGKRGSVHLRLTDVQDYDVWHCNLLEQKGEALPLVDGALEFPVRPYEIVSIMLEKRKETGMDTLVVS